MTEGHALRANKQLTTKITVPAAINCIAGRFIYKKSPAVFYNKQPGFFLLNDFIFESVTPVPLLVG
ncbi:MAG: hypothetical protein AAFN68_12110, partial [Pseudomonadota bacterium]